MNETPTISLFIGETEMCLIDESEALARFAVLTGKLFKLLDSDIRPRFALVAKR